MSAQRPVDLPTKAQLSRRFRASLGSHLVDTSGGSERGTAIYTLCDPRELRVVRYVGRTTSPRRRLLQHLNTARLWMPDEAPWWVSSPRLRPLYGWLRELYRDEQRLPVMLVTDWIEDAAMAGSVERAFVERCLAERLPLLNYEAGLGGPQLRLL
jgi:hypothetical protein